MEEERAQIAAALQIAEAELAVGAGVLGHAALARGGVESARRGGGTGPVAPAQLARLHLGEFERAGGTAAAELGVGEACLVPAISGDEVRWALDAVPPG